MVDQFLPHLPTRPGALIVNVSSGLAFIPFPAAPVYAPPRLQTISRCFQVHRCGYQRSA
ncbi:MAG: hypothetical protein JOZ42_09260 [Acetobacteraceae bacterium]|nr:hypothetical protein [Acetobacteraceae bacterium]